MEIVVIRTSADRQPSRLLREFGDKGLFVKEIEDALQERRADAGVHSLKDLPAVLPDGLVLAAVTERGDPRDTLVTRSGKPLAELPAGATIATASLRRRGQLLRLRPDVEQVDVRGNVDTRLRKLDEGWYDGLLAAASGLVRLALENRVTEFMEFDTMLPAAGQGAIGVEAPADSPFADVWRAIDVPDVHACVAAERDFVRAIGADCKTPVACTCERRDGVAAFHAMVCAPDGAEYLRVERRCPAGDEPGVAAEAAAELLRQGADGIIRRARVACGRGQAL